MGFGHRVYKNYDPRAKIMQKTCHEVLNETRPSTTTRCSKVAMELERIALHDEYFIEKKLYPNVDFYSGITLKAMGFPTTMFTVLFAVARTVGWIAQWKEMIEDPHQKIGRPRQLYTGAPRARLRADLAAQVSDVICGRAGCDRRSSCGRVSRVRAMHASGLDALQRMSLVRASAVAYPARYRRRARWAAGCRSP